jgi:hypothetical protein
MTRGEQSKRNCGEKIWKEKHLETKKNFQQISAQLNKSTAGLING